MSTRDLKWSQLKVGITVLISAVLLIAVLYAVTGQYGWFTHRISLVTYVEDAGGMRPGAQVNLEGVLVGSVTSVDLVANPPDPDHPVRVVMQVTGEHARWLRTDSQVELGTNGPLGETLVNISAGTLKAPPAVNGTVLPAQPSTGINQLLVSTHTVIENANLMVQRVGQILDQIQNGQGAMSKLINSSDLYDKFLATAANLQALTGKLNGGEGTMGKLLNSDEVYNRLNATLDNVNALVSTIQTGNGTAAKLINDPELYNQATSLLKSLQQTNELIQHGNGAIGNLLNDSPTSQRLTDSIAKLDQLLTQLQTGNGSLQKLMNDPTLYDNLVKATTDMDNLMVAIKNDPKHYLTIHLNIF